jgi:hypothetical protein
MSSKYHNVVTTLAGRTFASRAEARIGAIQPALLTEDVA